MSAFNEHINAVQLNVENLLVFTTNKCAIAYHDQLMLYVGKGWVSFNQLNTSDLNKLIEDIDNSNDVFPWKEDLEKFKIKNTSFHNELVSDDSTDNKFPVFKLTEKIINKEDIVSSLKTELANYIKNAEDMVKDIIDNLEIHNDRIRSCTKYSKLVIKDDVFLIFEVDPTNTVEKYEKIAKIRHSRKTISENINLAISKMAVIAKYRKNQEKADK